MLSRLIKVFIRVFVKVVLFILLLELILNLYVKKINLNDPIVNLQKASWF